MNIRLSALKRSCALLLIAAILMSVVCTASAEIRIDATILPESDNPVQTIITVNDLALGLLVPSENSTYYLFYWEDLPSVLSQLFGFDLGGLNTIELDDQVLSSLALRYGKIIISVAGIFNFSRKKMGYELSAFHTTPQCVVWTCTPSRRDWSKMLSKLFTTALSDNDLAAFLPSEVMEIVIEGQSHINDLTDMLDGLSFQAATDDNNIYAIKISRNGESICYQYPGVPSSEHAIVYEHDGYLSTLVYAVSELDSAALNETPERISSVDELAGILSFFLTGFSEFVSKTE